MKKVFLAIAIVTSFVACTSTEAPATEAAKVDSTVATVDSTVKAVVDSTVKVGDSTAKAVVDSIKK